MRIRVRLWAACLALLGLTQAANAVTYVYVDPVAHLKVTYADTTVGLFGHPAYDSVLLDGTRIFSGGTLKWLDTAFDVKIDKQSVTPRSQLLTQTSTFAFNFSALDGYTLSSVSFSEWGHYTRQGSSTLVAVSGDLFVTPLPGTSQLLSSLPAPSFSSSAVNQPWSSSAPSIILPPGSQAALVSIRDQLTARVTGLGLAEIAKSSAITFNVLPPPVPEPKSYMMLLAGGLAVAFVSWRRRAGRE